MVLKKPVVRAIFKRDLKRWFGNPTGYVFITLFVLLSAAALFLPDQFFQSNLANLATLNGWFPWLLLFFIPAITMSIWAGERGQGTDELLFTLPASDAQIVTGKFLAAAGIYTVALFFCFPILLFLAYLGDPDWGLLFCNFVGYWLLGLTLIAAGMVGSQLSDNLTIAFILGAIICSLVLLGEWAVGLAAPALARDFTQFGPVALFREMGRGILSFSAVFLFLGMVVVFLYLNLLLLSRRHWKSEGAEGLHLGVRFVSLLLATVSLTVLGANRAPRLDATVERIHSLSGETAKLIKGLDNKQPVYIRAYVSAADEVPKDYVQTRQTLLNLLREYDVMGGDRVQVRVIETSRFSDAARDAEKLYGIGFRGVPSEEGGQSKLFNFFLGLAITCGLEEVVIPFLDKGLPVEYELTRSIRTVASTERIKIGIVDNDVKVFGGFEFQTMAQDPQWEIVRELELQYEVERVDPATEYPQDIQALVAFMPSSLDQPQLDRLAQAVRGGLPTLLVDDPFPIANPGLGPTEPKGGPKNPFQQQNQPPPIPKGDIRAFLRGINVEWPYTSIVWDTYNPHRQFPAEPELVFVHPGSGSSEPFNATDPVTSGLQEIVSIFGGQVRSAGKTGFSFTPLLKTGVASGALDLNEVFNSNPFFGRSIRPNRRHVSSGQEEVLACRVQGQVEGGGNVHAIFIADLDMVSSQFFEIRRRGFADFSLDNVTFVLNCIDSLAGNEDFIDLRKRRPRHRTLTTLEEEENVFTQTWLLEKESAERQAEEELVKAQAELDANIDKIRKNMALDQRSKEIQIQSVQEVEQRKLDAAKAEIEESKERAIETALTEKTRQENKIRGFYRVGALAISPVPGLLIGLVMLVRRRKRESDSTVGTRRLGGAA